MGILSPMDFARRTFLKQCLTASVGIALLPIVRTLHSLESLTMTTALTPVTKTDAEWQQILSPEAYNVLRQHGTERAGTSPLNIEKRTGTFLCAGCQLPLYRSQDKYESGTGWPSFTQPISPQAIGTSVDKSWFSTRTEVHCARCMGHLGHVFPDGPPPTGQRYCMNGVALTFQPQS